MNLAIDIRCLMDQPLTGIGLYTQFLLNALFTADSSNQYFLFYSGLRKPTIPSFSFPNVHECFIRVPNKVFSAATLLTHLPRINRLIERKMHTTIDGMLFPNINFISVDCPYLMVCHDVSFAFFPHLFSRKQRLWHQAVQPARLYQQARTVIAVSNNTRNDCINTYALDPAKVVTVYPGIAGTTTRIEPHDPRIQNCKERYHLPDRFMVFLGTHEPRKNIDAVIAAFEHVQQTAARNLHLVIVGKPGTRASRIRQQVRRSAAAQQIHLIPYITAPDKPYLFSLARACVFPSLYEGFGFPPLEAMAQGCPTIVSSTSSLTEVTDGHAIVVNPYSVSDIATAITIAINQPRTIPPLLATRYNWDRAAQHMLEQLQLLKKPENNAKL